MSPNIAYLSFGSNINPEENVQKALDLLAQSGKLVAVSSVWETVPIGFRDQANFLNGAVIVETSLSASNFKNQVLRDIENRLGRVRTANKNAPRTMDLDIILFNKDVFENNALQIPSAELLERSFVAIPLAEIAPDYVHPITGQTLREIAQLFEAELTTMLKRDDLTLILP